MGRDGKHYTGDSGQPKDTYDHEMMREVCLDLGRETRKGVPEIIWAQNKDPQTVVEIVRRFLARRERAIVSRADPDTRSLIVSEFGEDHQVAEHARARVVVVRQRGSERKDTGGRVGIITAGTSDIPVADEARVIAEEMGCQVETAYDVGVAGLHRLFNPLSAMVSNEVDVIIVAAGMDGALPSVVSGIVGIPVIGLPTSVGYGLGGAGVTAILSMLQSCAPGLTVVNIDNGVGAGATAAMIANRMAAARRGAG